MIKDSGNRSEFESGAVRDIQVGKGRTDLIPWDCSIFEEVFDDDTIMLEVTRYYQTHDAQHLVNIFYDFSIQQFGCPQTAMLELSKHFEEGAKKYGEYNWQKGIPASSYMSSAIRHYLKFKRGDRDEPHDRAFLWNIVCMVWTCENFPDQDNIDMLFGLHRKIQKLKIKAVLFCHRLDLRRKMALAFLKR